MVNYLEWDSNFFGLRIGKATVSSQGEMNELLARQNGLQKDYDLIYIFAQEGLNTIQDNVKLVDNKVIYVKHVNVLEPFTDEHVVDYESNSVSPYLLNLALASGVYSRFNLDHNFPRNSYEKLYSCWIEQSVKRVIASDVFCYMIDGIPRGLLTLNRKGTEGVIGLVATDKSFRGRGIGQTLLEYTDYYSHVKGIGELTVATQLHNTVACHLYEKVGFVKKTCTDIWHWWLL